MVTDSGLWLKDEINNHTLIVKANYIEGNFLIDVINIMKNQIIENIMRLKNQIVHLVILM